jgi:hypothetical protein
VAGSQLRFLQCKGKARLFEYSRAHQIGMVTDDHNDGAGSE